jgi:hypothetical protein
MKNHQNKILKRGRWVESYLYPKTETGQFMETWPLVVAVILSLAMLATPLLTHTDTPTDDEGALIKKEVEE